jgi:hypothetical protein
MTIRLVEKADLAAPSAGNRWNCRLMSAGQGSSAFYPAEVLKEYGPTTFLKGTQVFFDHPTEDEDVARGGSRSIKDYAGVLEEDATWNDEDEGLYAPVKFTKNALALVEEAHNDIALSIDVRKFELRESAEHPKEVAKMFAHPLNNVAIVPRGGRDGKIVSLIESFRESSPESGGTERKNMTPEEITALSEALSTSLVAALTPALTEALKPAEQEKPDEGKTDEVDVVAVVEAAHEAGLTKAGRARVVEGAKAGKDATALIEAEKAELAEILAEAKKDDAPAGRLKESGSGSTDDFTVGGW